MNDLQWCIDFLRRYNGIERELPCDWPTFRALVNVTMPIDLPEEFYLRQDLVLREELSKKVVVDIASFPDGISLFKGDITLVKADAIVDACNAKMLGCFVPGHHCVDNAIHTYAGLQVRRDMMGIMDAQGHDEPNGQVKVSNAYNLPCEYIFHTVGPIYSGDPRDEADLTSCYRICLDEAEKMGLKSIVFCSLSTGIFGFPIEKACRIAIAVAKGHLKERNRSVRTIVFDVFSEHDYETYSRAIKEMD